MTRLLVKMLSEFVAVPSLTSWASIYNVFASRSTRARGCEVTLRLEGCCLRCACGWIEQLQLFRVFQWKVHLNFPLKIHLRPNSLCDLNVDAALHPTFRQTAIRKWVFLLPLSLRSDKYHVTRWTERATRALILRCLTQKSIASSGEPRCDPSHRARICI
jgi:hypothetical protein